MNKLTNFENTLKELKSFLAIPIQNDRDIAGIIQGFEFTFEQSWKCIQKVAFELGTEIGSPKAAFTFALQNNWIKAQEESLWIELLKDRNLTSHTYQEDLAKKIVGKIKSDYVAMFEGLLDHLKKV